MLEGFYKSEKFKKLQQALQKGKTLLVEELWDAPKALLLSIATKASGKNILVLTGKSVEENHLYDDLSYFLERPVVDFPAWETLPSENIAPSPDIVGQRYQILESILEQKEPIVILSSLQAALQHLISPDQFKSLYLSISHGDEFPYETLIERLNAMGYQRCPVVSDKEEFAVRGGIIDVFPVASCDPYRIEFFGDTIESIRLFDPIGQKSIKSTNHLEITPAKELELLGTNTKFFSIFDYLGKNTIVCFDDLLALEDRYATLVSTCGKATKHFASLASLLDRALSLQKIFFAELPISELSLIELHGEKGGYYSHQRVLQSLSFQMFGRNFNALRWQNAFTPVTHYLLPEDSSQEATTDEILLALSKLPTTEYDVKILCQTEAELSALKKRILDQQFQLPEKTEYQLKYLSTGFVLHDIRLILLSMTELTGRFKIRRQKQRSTYHTTPSESYDLVPGELVVHYHNGIGKFLGVKRKPDHLGADREYFLIEYADESKLFVPLNQAHLVNKYIGTSQQIPKLHKLGSVRWKKVRENTERAIMGYATELLQMYAKRKMQRGFVYPGDSPDILSFDEEFPYVETEDQLLAIKSIKSDMCSEKAMDRLVCGDVGYGKTEVAMRAAFKAILDGGKQVALLVPTTVLAMQHYDNFVERMQHFPIRVEVLSRFRTKKQIDGALKGIEEGAVDIVIGTHRLISKDVTFKNLGLIIIDEEQRFGVRVKEHLKKLKTNVDCLTLSATPIPRTLYLSLIGARDLSVINTPPQDRLPIKTIIAEPRDDLIKTALLRELSRDGQAYFIHNRVETIYNVQEYIQKLLPQAKVSVVHGQMHSDEIDQVFHAFKKGKIDILVSTTIVENGVDIPNANTILIERADHFGLADLYQLRGRVGRWNRRAYAYFLISRLKSLPEITRKRLLALAESSGYGGGMKLAMRDLEIRGAGNILGEEQSGHVASIGFPLYCKLLNRMIKALEGSESAVFQETKVEIPVNAYLPEDYINEPKLRMEIYQRLGDATSIAEVESLWEEMHDRFGLPPQPVSWLYHQQRLRVFAAKRNYTFVKVEGLTLFSEQKRRGKLHARQQLLGKFKEPLEMEKKIVALLE